MTIHLGWMALVAAWVVFSSFMLTQTAADKLPSWAKGTIYTTRQDLWGLLAILSAAVTVVGAVWLICLLAGWA